MTIPHHDELLAAGWTPCATTPDTYRKGPLGLNRQGIWWVAWADGICPTSSIAPWNAVLALQIHAVAKAKEYIHADWKRAATLLDIARACEVAR
jgi:hypothetical protein